ncbi:FtsK/SpoIIIE domain-containing protein [Paenibacillus tyrfis]|uniref:FtsK/SpoIIIE domain-containing protein n=1 Tax=Paenibacillus tyrfis TaxID=1501230 RepID=UPI000B588831|nr:FtsK/SpoIIIE domain-containing protein [Paenibacillus tyrfis]
MEERRGDRGNRPPLANDMLTLGGFLILAGFILFKLTDGESWDRISWLLIKIGAVIIGFGVIPLMWKHRKRVLKVSLTLLALVGCFIQGRRSFKRTNQYPGPSSGPAFEPEPITTPEVKPAAENIEAPVLANKGNHPLTLLPSNPRPRAKASMTEENAGEWISNALQLVGFTIEAPVEILSIESGPTLQSISFRLPPKVQLSALVKKRDDLANHLGCGVGFDVENSRFQSSASFVIPHMERAYVYLREIMSSDDYRVFVGKAELPIVLGVNMLGKPILVDLAKLPHLLVAGATGSGKSVAINGILGSLLSVCDPESLQLLLIDPKMVELSIYKGFPHLITPPITEMRRVGLALGKVIVEMERRYEVMAKAGSRKISDYNRKNPGSKLPFIVVIVDEYAELMMIAGDATEDAIQRIAQKARAAGIHMIMATQRPSVDVVTGTIKANLPSRIAFRLLSSHDFRTVMDTTGPGLLGNGDGVAMLQGGQQIRFQSASISADDAESTTFIEDLKQYWRGKYQAAAPKEMTISLDDSIATDLESLLQEDMEHQEDISGADDISEDEPITGNDVPDPVNEDILYGKAKALAASRGNISTDLLKLHFSLTYVQANGIMYRMDEDGLLGDMDWSTNTRPWIGETKSPEEKLLDQMRYLICRGTIRTEELRNALGIRKDKVLSMLQQLVQEGMLEAPTSAKKGYTLIWDEDQILAYIEARDADDI